MFGVKWQVVNFLYPTPELNLGQMGSMTDFVYRPVKQRISAGYPMSSINFLMLIICTPGNLGSVDHPT